MAENRNDPNIYARVMRYLSTCPEKDFEALCRIASRSPLPVDQFLLELYSLPRAELKRLLPLAFRK